MDIHELNLIPFPQDVCIQEGINHNQTVEFVIDVTLREEAYQLVVDRENIRAIYATDIGKRYSMVTLSQLKIQYGENIPCMVIRDEPIYASRGFMLDSSRHFLPVSDVKRLLQSAAFFKMNRMHWHLTDDQAWRLEIKRYPRLTSVGARRGKTFYAELPEPEPERNDGYFTQREVRDIVAYAQDLGIEIIPEIEVPGHASAMLEAYPEYSCPGFEADSVRTTGGVFESIICAGNKTSITFLEDILDEVMELFPYPVIHIGGDEAVKAHWRSCPLCQSKMRAKGLLDENALQQDLIIELGQYLADHGRRTMVWNESLRGRELPIHFIVQQWSGDHELTADFLHRGGLVVQSSNDAYYMDYPYGVIDLTTIFAYDPIPEWIDRNDASNIIGIQCNLWTERVPTFDKACQMLFPRLPAVAEVAWTAPQNRYDDWFVERYQGLVDYLQCQGIQSANRRLWRMTPEDRRADIDNWKRMEGNEFCRANQRRIQSILDKEIEAYGRF